MAWQPAWSGTGELAGARRGPSHRRGATAGRPPPGRGDVHHGRPGPHELRAARCGRRLVRRAAPPAVGVDPGGRGGAGGRGTAHGPTRRPDRGHRGPRRWRVRLEAGPDGRGGRCDRAVGRRACAGEGGPRPRRGADGHRTASGQPHGHRAARRRRRRPRGADRRHRQGWRGLDRHADRLADDVVVRRGPRRARDYDVVTNTPPGAPFRGPGGPPAMWALEQAVDEVAHRLARIRWRCGGAGTATSGASGCTTTPPPCSDGGTGPCRDAAAAGSGAGSRIPQLGDTPEIEVHFDEEGWEHAPGGGVGLGEVATIGVAASVGNAIHNATGWRPLDLPVTPDRVVEALR
ncbi:MAG TPA: molybdopterin cofactor-binding domain-containing protein [Euzebyales bacterium]|nr:molybdopterin cofactor-binding domain-containing protein [Euzebyales bacterium]